MRKPSYKTGRKARHMSQKHLIKHENAEEALEQNVKAYIDAEKKQMGQYRYAVKMKPVTGEMNDELKQMRSHLHQIQLE